MSSKGRQFRRDFPDTVDGFVGRGPELDRIRTLLGSARLITLIGMGGIGKTRLAAEAVSQFRKATRTPVRWVRLARLAKGAGRTAVEEEVAHAVLDSDFSGRSVWDTLVDKLSGKDAVGRDLPTVVVMDNCEHVLADAASLIVSLLEAVPGLVVLATSREPVGWVDEHLVEVPPLSPHQALTLFRQRAELTGHAVTGKSRLATAERICRHMHNNPLYIRLAAARLRRQPLEAILHELNGGASDKRLRWPRAWRVGTEARHERIFDVIAWSYDLCTDKERLLLARMSVFAAGSESLRMVRDSLGYNPSPEDNDGHFGFDVGADLEAIEAVCADDAERARDAAVSVTKEEIEGLLERLVDQSLVTQHMTETSVRYSLLETIRVFARQQLRTYSTDEVDESARVVRRHRRYYRDKVLRAYATWYGPAELEQLEWVRASWDNILVAIEGSLTTPDESVLGVEISVGLMALRAPWFNGSLRETRQWAERTLEASRTQTTRPTDLHIVAMALIGWLALWQGQRADTERLLQDCIDAYTDDPEIRRNWRRNPDVDHGLPAPFEFVWGQELMVMHRDPVSIIVLARAREKSRALGDPGSEAMGKLLEAMAAGFFGSAEQALALARRNVDDFAAAGALWLKSWAEMLWALALTKHGDPTTALSVGHSALTHLVSVRDHWGATLAVHIRCWSLARIITDSIATGGADKNRLVTLATETARLVGGARTLRAEVGTNIEELGPFADETDKAIDIARGVLGAGAFAAIEKEGAALRPEKGEVQRLALGTLPMGRPRTGGHARIGSRHLWDELTRAEQEVATYAAAGWTNTAIAVRRGSSYRTVDAQMASIFHKLMITSRKDIVPFVPEGRIDEVRPRTEYRQRHSKERHHRSRQG